MFRCGRFSYKGGLIFKFLICFIGSSCIVYYFSNHIFIWHLSRQIRLTGYLPENFNFIPKSMFVTLTEPDNHHIKRDAVHSMKTILVWTKFFGHDDWITDSTFSECEVKTCKVSSNKLDLESADAVAFHPRDIHSNDWPSIRLQHQRWILFSMEPPYYNSLDYAAYSNIFNWTMMMRRDSDFPISYLGGGLLLTDNPELWRTRTTILSSRSRLVAARISNCFATTTHRLAYIAELRKYIPVDVYGKCGNFRCNNDCKKELKMYKFYLSFENGFCRNYITEKFWLPFEQFDSVPIVMGGGHVDDYKEIAPPHSYINVADFSSPEQLAKYLILLDKSPLLYREFFRWQLSSNISLGALTQRFSTDHPWCGLCKSLQDPSLTRQHYHDLDGWIKQDTCMMSSSHCKLNINVLLFAFLTPVTLWFIAFFHDQQ